MAILYGKHYGYPYPCAIHPSTFAPHIFKTAAQIKAEALTEAKADTKASQADTEDTG